MRAIRLWQGQVQDRKALATPTLAGNVRQHVLASSAGFNAAAGRLQLAAGPAGKHGLLRQSPAPPPESPAVPQLGGRGVFEPSSAGRSGLGGIGMAAGARISGGAGAALNTLLGQGGGGMLRAGGGGGVGGRQGGLLPRSGIPGVMSEWQPREGWRGQGVERGSALRGNSSDSHELAWAVRQPVLVSPPRPYVPHCITVSPSMNTM